MFSKHFKARFMKSNQDVVNKGTEGADIRRNRLVFVYDFTPELATCMGKRAVAMQKQLLREKDSDLTASSIKIDLDTKTVSVNVKHKNHKVLEIERTLAITAKATKPTASAAGPSLEVALLSELDGPQLDFINEFLNEGVYVRLDRQQIDIPGTADQGEDGAAE